jgi:hypothetical protein
VVDIPENLLCQLSAGTPAACQRLGVTELGGKRFCVTHREGIVREGRKLLEWAAGAAREADDA